MVILNDTLVGLLSGLVIIIKSSISGSEASRLIGNFHTPPMSLLTIKSKFALNGLSGLKFASNYTSSQSSNVVDTIFNLKNLSTNIFTSSCIFFIS